MFALRRSLICRKTVARLSGQAQVKPPPKPPANTVTVNIDGRDITVHKNMTVLQACEEAGAQIPRFCYHPRLSIAGNCRMCLVEVAKSPKPVASCAMPLMPGMIIKTNTPMVKKAREGVMEFLLINHPLDCPICDQGGECDLQDLSIDYGSDRSRYREWKRTVEDKNIGPMVKTVMTRCIHCTRCVRFAEEIAGVPDLCATGRGNSVEIGTYFEKPFDSELSGNVVDLCPVGALTSKPFAFAARPWELQKTDSIDVHDSLGAAIRVDTRGSQVMRILPSLNEMINEEWISDRSRNACDGLALQRLDTPMVRSSNGTLQAVTWPEAFAKIHEKFSALDPRKDIRALVGDITPAEGIICLKDWLNSFGCFDIDCREHGNKTDAGLRSGYLFNSTISGIEKADFILFVGTNLRMEAPVLNARIRRCQQETGLLELASIGPQFKDIYNGCEHLGNDISILTKIAEGKHHISKKLAAAKFPMIIIGQSVMQRKDLPSVQSTIALLTSKIAKNLMTPEWNGVSVLQLHASRAGAMDLGIVSTANQNNKPKFVYLLGCDDFADEQVPADAFVVYQGHHGDAGASRADVVLPSTAYTETSGIFVNTEGRPQMTTKATTALGLARDDWQILRALSEVVEPDSRLSYDTIEAVRQRLFDVCPHWKKMGEVQSSQTVCSWLPGNPAPPLKQGKISPAVTNFFTTNVIARASLVMARAQVELKDSTNSYIQE